MSDALELAMALMARRSITPEDAGCQQMLAGRLAAAGFEADWRNFGEVTNVVISHGQGSPSLWFLGHTDVVPSGPERLWSSPPFEPTVRDGLLIGRGACDMKGSVAAMVVALERFVAANPSHPGQVGLFLTSDEEGIAIDGIRRAMPALAEDGRVPDHCLVGEPSSQKALGDTLRIGRRGSIAATLTIAGVQGHTAFPETIDNPVHRLAPFLRELTTHRWDEGVDDASGAFPPTNCQVSNIEAGTGASNVTPAEVKLRFSLRFNTRWTSASLREAVEAMLNRHGLTDFELEWWVSGEPFLSAPGPLRSALVEAVREELGVEPVLNTGGGTSDGRFLAPLGVEVVELGLLNRTIHKVDEAVATDDPERLAATYFSVLERLFTG